MGSEDCRQSRREILGIFTFIDFALIRVTSRTGQPRSLLTCTGLRTGEAGLGKYTLIWHVSSAVDGCDWQLRFRRETSLFRPLTSFLSKLISLIIEEKRTVSQTDTDSAGAGRGGTGHEDEAAVGGGSC